MNGAACLFEPAPVDTGDVLASIRRLIASDNPTTSGRGPGDDGARMTGAPFARDAALPCATGLGCARSGRTPVPGVHVGRMAALPEAASLAVPGAAGQVDSDLPQVPLRLNPEAMIAMADAAGHSPAPLRLSGDTAAVQPSATAPEEGGWGAEQPAADLLPDTIAVAPGTPQMAAAASADTQPAPDAGDSPHAEPDAEIPVCGANDLTSPSNKETTMHAYPTGVVSPLHAEPVTAGAAERCAHNAAHVIPPAAASAHAAPVAEENPLRALLREVVREEFEAEMQRRLDENLRSMIRGEIVVALTEALVRRPA